jgi:hypothetical protein
MIFFKPHEMNETIKKTNLGYPESPTKEHYYGIIYPYIHYLYYDRETGKVWHCISEIW